jgi:hypothetical protein
LLCDNLGAAQSLKANTWLLDCVAMSATHIKRLQVRAWTALCHVACARIESTGSARLRRPKSDPRAA